MLKKIKSILARMIAVIIATGLGTIGAGSLVGLEVWKTAGLAALMGVAVVSEELARAYLIDGDLTDEEINAAFAKVDNEVASASKSK
jgi:hypothetical protein